MVSGIRRRLIAGLGFVGLLPMVATARAEDGRECVFYANNGTYAAPEPNYRIRPDEAMFAYPVVITASGENVTLFGAPLREAEVPTATAWLKGIFQHDGYDSLPRLAGIAFEFPVTAYSADGNVSGIVGMA